MLTGTVIKFYLAYSRFIFCIFFNVFITVAIQKPFDDMLFLKLM